MGRKRISGIYTITNTLTDQIYVGKSVSVLDRLKRHEYELKQKNHENPYLQLAFDKYGIVNFKFELLVECTEILLASEEHYWCNLLNTHIRKYGYNLFKTHPEAHGRQCEESMHRATKALRNKSKEHIYKIQIAKRNSGSIDKMSDKIRQLTLDGKEIRIYVSIREAEKGTKINRTTIAKTCKGIIKTPTKFKWEYVTKGILNKNND